jgi:Ca-activated chloride channel family protein
MTVGHVFRAARGISLVLLLMAPMLLRAGDASGVSVGWWRDLWRTPDQQAQRLFDAGDYAAAATRFTDPMRIGTAWYRAGDFDRAAAAFGQLASAEGHFNRANALLLQGEYEDAIAAYDQALAQQLDWQLARANRAIAVARQERLAPPDDDAGGTGGMLEADEIVFDTSGRTEDAKGEQTTEGGAGLTDAQMRDLWLRRVETRPADFLRARFTSQLQLREAGTP